MRNFHSFSKPLKAAFGLCLVMLISVIAADAQSGGLKGRVKSNSGQGIANASVTLTRDNDDFKSTKSASDGSFEIKGLEPGFYGLRVDADGYASGTLFSVEIKKGKVRDLGDKLFLRVDQGTLVILRGSVFFKEGTSITGAKVELERVNPDGTTKDLGSTTTSVTGEFVFRQPPGSVKYRVMAKYNGVVGTKEISVEQAAVYRLAISLDLSSRDK
jgi:hypothetical protein